MQNDNHCKITAPPPILNPRGFQIISNLKKKQAKNALLNLLNWNKWRKERVETEFKGGKN